MKTASKRMTHTSTPATADLHPLGVSLLRDVEEQLDLADRGLLHAPPATLAVLFALAVLVLDGEQQRRAADLESWYRSETACA